ncbi:MAG: hypothetical protein ACRETH_08320 [Steroidobacteraceae bacterium]
MTGTLIPATVCASAAERERRASKLQQTKDSLNSAGSLCPRWITCH